jgi:hypothetical protein
MQSTRVKLEFTNDEALVLYNWLARFNQQANADFADQAEEPVLFDLEAMLQKLIVAPLQANYAELLARARANVRAACERRHTLRTFAS